MTPYLCTPALRPEIHPHIHELLMKMKDIYFSHDLFWETSIYLLLLDILLTIGRFHYNQNNMEGSHAADNNQQKYYEIFAGLLNYVDAHYTEELTLEQPQAHSGSPGHAHCQPGSSRYGYRFSNRL